MNCTKVGTRKRKVNEKEVVEFYTDVLRNPEEKGLKPTDAIKAAEFFSKYYNMLEKGADTEGNVTIIDDIGGNDGK